MFVIMNGTSTCRPPASAQPCVRRRQLAAGAPPPPPRSPPASSARQGPQGAELGDDIAVSSPLAAPPSRGSRNLRRACHGCVIHKSLLWGGATHTHSFEWASNKKLSAAFQRKCDMNQSPSSSPWPCNCRPPSRTPWVHAGLRFTRTRLYFKCGRADHLCDMTAAAPECRDLPTPSVAESARQFRIMESMHYNKTLHMSSGRPATIIVLPEPEGDQFGIPKAD